MAKAPKPAAAPRPPMPATGGRSIRDPKSGDLTLVEQLYAPAAEPAPHDEKEA